MMRIWGRISSINVRKVVFTAQWLGLPFERIDAGGSFGIVHEESYRSRNFNALVPLLEEDDGFTLWESNVIVRYLAARHSQGALYPVQLRERFEAERWMDWQQTTLNPAGRDAFVQLIRTPQGERRQDLVDASVARTEPLFDHLEELLAQRAFIAADRMTMADIPLACEVHRWSGLPIQHKPRPGLARWYSSILAMPAARGVLDIPLS